VTRGRPLTPRSIYGWLLTPLTLLMLLAVHPAGAALRAWVDNQQVTPGETIELVLAHDGQTSAEPDLAPLKQDFDILSRSSSSSLQITNGSTSSTTQLTLTLSPKRAGRLIIPSISWGSDHSNPLTVDVAPSSGNQGAGADATSSRVFVETDIDPKSPYVQAGVHVTTRVYTSVPLSRASLEFPDSDAIVVKQAGADTNSTAQKNGQSYQVITRHYVVFPQHSGHLILSGPVLSGNMAVSSHGDPNDPLSRMFGNNPFGGMLNMTKPIRLNGQPIQLDVQPRPAGAGNSYWVPAENVSLSAKWNPQQMRGHVGDPLTVTLHLQAQDLTAAQLPDLSTLLSLPDGLKAYPDEPKLKDQPNGNDLIAEREQNVALIADQPGHFTIPELKLSWWDTRTNQAREAILPAQTLVVEAAPGSQVPPAAAMSDQQKATARADSSAAAPAKMGGNSPGSGATNAVGGETTPWKWISLGLGSLWVLTLAAWFLTRRRGSGNNADYRPTEQAPQGSPSKAAAHGAFLTACKANDPQAARRSLLAWAHTQLPGQHVPGLSALAKILGDDAIADLLRNLDRACYTGQAWKGDALGQALQKWPTPEGARVEPAKRLAPLYR
jgi:hypothetical protein